MVANREKGGMEYGMEGWEDRSLVFIDTYISYNRQYNLSDE
jgi:hypothetical protein